MRYFVEEYRTCRTPLWSFRHVSCFSLPFTTAATSRHLQAYSERTLNMEHSNQGFGAGGGIFAWRRRRHHIRKRRRKRRWRRVRDGPPPKHWLWIWRRRWPHTRKRRRVRDGPPPKLQAPAKKKDVLNMKFTKYNQ